MSDLLSVVLFSDRVIKRTMDHMMPFFEECGVDPDEHDDEVRALL